MDISLSNIIGGDTSIVEYIEIDLEDFSSEEIESIEYDEINGNINIVLGVFENGDYLLKITLRDSSGTIVEETLILTE